MKSLNILEGLSFDSSLSENLDKTVSGDEFKERIISLLTPILQSRFTGQPSKQNIRTPINRVNFACPYCMDSMKNPHKKRGNIILAGKHRNFYKCHNCGIFKRVDNFFKDFKVDLQLDIINFISTNLGDFGSSSGNFIETSMLLDIDNIEEYAIDRQELKKRLNLIEIKESSVLSWLNDRLQFNYERFLYNPLKNYLFILNLTPNKKIFGAQSRMFNPSKGHSHYMTYKLSKLYELLEKTEEIPDDINTMSIIFKILEININLAITLFEGPLDAFLFKNSVANTGANKSFPIDIPLRYFYDYDATGIKKSIEHIQQGESVFLWEKFRKDYDLPYRKKWDLTDAMVYFKKNNIRTPHFENYFSNDPLDIIDI